LLVLTYFGSIILLQALFTAVSGQESAVAIVISTLIIATLFNPLRHRVQDLFDRRFFRKKYAAKKILTTYSARAGEAVDLDEMAAEMARVVQETMQPANISLWLQDDIENK
jgi:divalent metal cation (Fe/Co/Zn/Cd) transporter